MHLPVHVHQSDPRGPVKVFCPDLPGCSAAAPSVEVALELLRRRVRAYFAASTRRVPAGTRIVTIEV
jgi:predicted RNase H-like HicB family nuclease